ncbi:MAG TPA: hypothetical protein PKM89_01650 [Bacteroidales bacterium]|nr:hypothetical protein [Bacteroidales bacterium]
MKLKTVTVCLMAVLMAAGCSRYKDVSIENVAVKQFNMTSLSTAKVKIEATINNPTGSRLYLKAVTGVIRLDNKSVASFTMDTTLLFTPRGISTNEGNLHLKITNLMSLFSGSFDLDESVLERLKLDFNATVRSGCIKHHMKFMDIPAKNIFEL